ncbi:MAG: hypothetical protein NDI69_13165 [Bacteriovoracaceae bacterium]|nr:hypothetical protein [Bacteriovoracaceae bacterium]
MIYNKSGHPVEVKKISIRLWGLRDEIEAAIGRRMKECEAAGIPLYIEDIKNFYKINDHSSMPDNVIPMGSKSTGEDMNTLMESLGEETQNEGTSGALNEAEEIIAEQTLQGLETKTPNPILERPYQRQAPDLDKVSYGFTLLSDINMEQMLSFTKDKFLQGQSVVIEFLIPQNFMLTADVTYCHHYAMRSRIISSTKPDYRVQCKFTFSMKGERNNLRNFLKSIEPNVTDKKKNKKDNEDDSLGI